MSAGVTTHDSLLLDCAIAAPHTAKCGVHPRLPVSFSRSRNQRWQFTDRQRARRAWL